MKTVTTMVAAALLAASNVEAKPTKQPQMGANDFGAYPSNYRELVDDWLKTFLKDPYSVRDLTVKAPEQGWIKQGWLAGGKKFNGYLVVVTLNSKNGFGAYTGVQTYNLLIQNGHVVAHQWLNQPNRAVTGPDWVIY
jgi:hypothetical protein